MISLVRSEATKLLTGRATWILTAVTLAGTLLMTWVNAAQSVGVPAGSDQLYSSVPVPPEYQGFEMVGFGYALVVALAALWAGSEYRSGGQIRTTLLATPRRLRVIGVKAALLAVLIAVLGFLTTTGTMMIAHAVEKTGIDPWTLTPTIWAGIGGVTLAWTLTALIAFAVGTIARSAIAPLILVEPLVIGVGDFLATVWTGARYLPTSAGTAMYADPSAGPMLTPGIGGVVQAGWAGGLLLVAAVVFARRDV
jgi:ABC-type transport system involved in multi-copper enzyme maturation permease subunit